MQEKHVEGRVGHETSRICRGIAWEGRQSTVREKPCAGQDMGKMG